MSLPTNKHERDVQNVRSSSSSSSHLAVAQSKRVKIPMQLMGLAHREADKLEQSWYMRHDGGCDDQGDDCVCHSKMAHVSHGFEV
jgi:hypothetical protein